MWNACGKAADENTQHSLPCSLQQTRSRSRLGYRGSTTASSGEAGSVGQVEEECSRQPCGTDRVPLAYNSVTYREQSERHKMHSGRTEQRRSTYEMAMKNGRGGALLKDLNVLQMSQRSKTNSALKAANDQDRIVRTEDKL